MQTGQINGKRQSEEFALFMAFCYVVEAEDPEQAIREIEEILSYDGDCHGRGSAIK